MKARQKEFELFAVCLFEKHAVNFQEQLLRQLSAAELRTFSEKTLNLLE